MVLTLILHVRSTEHRGCAPSPQGHAGQQGTGPGPSLHGDRWAWNPDGRGQASVHLSLWFEKDWASPTGRALSSAWKGGDGVRTRFPRLKNGPALPVGSEGIWRVWAACEWSAGLGGSHYGHTCGRPGHVTHGAGPLVPTPLSPAPRTWAGSVALLFSAAI